MKPSIELIELINKSLAKSITRVEMARLEELLEQDSNLDYYLRMTSVEANLYHLPASELKISPLKSRPVKKAWPRLAAAALIIFSTGMIAGKYLLTSPPAPVETASLAKSNQDSAASITSMIGVTWTSLAPEGIDLTEESREIAIDSGLVEVTFQSGVRTIIEGPANFKITGGNAAYLSRGRIVADVPDGAEGFTVSYMDGKVIDLGTEFALHVPEDRAPVEVGVFRGEVEVYTQDETPPMKVLENHAIKYGGKDGQHFSSIPFERRDYIRELPSREFPWALPKTPTTETSALVFDVSHLVWKSGDYQAIFKWMQGRDATCIQSAELRKNGIIVSSDDHPGKSGMFSRTFENTYSFHIDERPQRSDTWTLHLNVIADDRGDEKVGSFIPESSGTLLFEDSQSLNAQEAAFLGTWEYRHNDDVHQRTFNPDHTANYRINGKETSEFTNATWTVKDGILTLTMPRVYNGVRNDMVELHRLRDEQELIFLNQPYRNGYRVK